MGQTAKLDLPTRWVLRREYERILARLTIAYNAAGPAKRERLEASDDAFRAFIEGEDADPMPLVRWARSVVPGAFPARLFRPGEAVRRAQAALRLPSLPAAEWLEPPPEGPLYHGTRAWQDIRTRGLCVRPGNYSLVDPEYGWRAYWADEQWRVYRSLTREQKNRLHGPGRNEHWTRAMFRAEGLFDAAPVALLFVTRRLATARSYGERSHDKLGKYKILRLDPSNLRYYWWSSDELQEEQSYVFAMPTDCPQALPGAFTAVDPETGADLGNLAAHALRGTSFGHLAAYFGRGRKR